MRAVNALGASLDTMLDVSRLDAGVITPAPQPVQLDALFLPLNHTFAARAEHKQLQLRVRASGLWVHSDPQLLHRMLSNLMDNALKYTTRGGVTVTARERGDAVWIEVRDSGIGIAPEQSSRIFEEFYQVNNPGATAHGAWASGCRSCSGCRGCSAIRCRCIRDRGGAPSLGWCCLPWVCRRSHRARGRAAVGSAPRQARARAAGPRAAAGR
jgi:hypothetical protein